MKLTKMRQFIREAQEIKGKPAPVAKAAGQDFDDDIPF
jgi:hypothetical protein